MNAAKPSAAAAGPSARADAKPSECAELSAHGARALAVPARDSSGCHASFSKDVRSFHDSARASANFVNASACSFRSFSRSGQPFNRYVRDFQQRQRGSDQAVHNVLASQSAASWLKRIDPRCHLGKMRQQMEMPFVLFVPLCGCSPKRAEANLGLATLWSFQSNEYTSPLGGGIWRDVVDLRRRF